MDFIHTIPDDQLSIFDNKYILAVIGSRAFINKEYIYESITKLIKWLYYKKEIEGWSSVIIISGKAKGVDSIANEYAYDHNLTVINILPDWDLYGKSAGFKRNYNIILHADRVLAFCLNKSGGTMNSINHATRLGKPCNVLSI